MQDDLRIKIIWFIKLRENLVNLCQKNFMDFWFVHKIWDYAIIAILKAEREFYIKNFCFFNCFK